MGFEVRQRTFEFSELPGRFATPLIGAAGALLVGSAGRLASEGERYVPLIVMTIGVAILVAASIWLATKAVLDAPIMRSLGVNLQATRMGAAPSLWLCAHLDSKSQPIPTLVRTIGLVLESVGVLMTFVLCIAIAIGTTIHTFFWTFAAALTLLGAIPVVLSMVTERSPGALDNASGVATIVAAARDIGHDPRVGVLITDGEELGLAGARAWVRQNSDRGSTILNTDGVDDVGDIQVMYSGVKPTALVERVRQAAREAGIRCHVGRLVPGILTDSVAFGAAGIPTVTFSRGTWGSLARVHSGRDDLAHLRGTGIAEVAKLVAATVRTWKQSS